MHPRGRSGPKLPAVSTEIHSSLSVEHFHVHTEPPAINGPHSWFSPTVDRLHLNDSWGCLLGATGSWKLPSFQAGPDFPHNPVSVRAQIFLICISTALRKGPTFLRKKLLHDTALLEQLPPEHLSYLPPPRPARPRSRHKPHPPGSTPAQLRAAARPGAANPGAPAPPSGGRAGLRRARAGRSLPGGSRKGPRQPDPGMAAASSRRPPHGWTHRIEGPAPAAALPAAATRGADGGSRRRRSLGGGGPQWQLEVTAPAALPRSRRVLTMAARSGGPQPAARAARGGGRRARRPAELPRRRQARSERCMVTAAGSTAGGRPRGGESRRARPGRASRRYGRPSPQTLRRANGLPHHNRPAAGRARRGPAASACAAAGRGRPQGGPRAPLPAHRAGSACPEGNQPPASEGQRERVRNRRYQLTIRLVIALNIYETLPPPPQLSQSSFYKKSQGFFFSPACPHKGSASTCSVSPNPVSRARCKIQKRYTSVIGCIQFFEPAAVHFGFSNIVEC